MVQPQHYITDAPILLSIQSWSSFFVYIEVYIWSRYILLYLHNTDDDDDDDDDLILLFSFYRLETTMVYYT